MFGKVPNSSNINHEKIIQPMEMKYFTHCCKRRCFSVGLYTHIISDAWLVQLIFKLRRVIVSQRLYLFV